MIVPFAVASGETETVGSLAVLVLIGVGELSGVGLGGGEAVAALVAVGTGSGVAGVAEGVAAALTAVCRIAQTASNGPLQPSIISSETITGTIPIMARCLRAILMCNLAGRLPELEAKRI